MPKTTKTITIPAAVDLHVHFREPSNNKAETIASGSKAALLGGYGLVCDMPNNPGNPTWTLAKVEEKENIIKRTSSLPIALYSGSQPESDNLDQLATMSSRTIGLKIYGSPNVTNYQDYKIEEFDPIVRQWHRLAPAKPIMFHRGESDLAEAVTLIAEKLGHQLHICHVNNPAEVEVVSAAKKKGLSVTCGICPHHLFKTSHDSRTQGWFARMLPALAPQIDAEELWSMFVKGEIDALETDHAPHLPEKKWAAEQDNPEGKPGPTHTTCFGVPGIEFALPLLFYQMKRGTISLERIVEAVSSKPAEIIGVKLSDSSEVTWTLEEYRIGERYPKGLSGSGWTPYLNNLAVGVVQKSVIGGKILIEGGKLKASLSRVANSGSVI